MFQAQFDVKSIDFPSFLSVWNFLSRNRQRHNKLHTKNTNNKWLTAVTVVPALTDEYNRFCYFSPLNLLNKWRMSNILQKVNAYDCEQIIRNVNQTEMMKRLIDIQFTFTRAHRENRKNLQLCILASLNSLVGCYHFF